jgi:hypothetical protein
MGVEFLGTEVRCDHPKCHESWHGWVSESAARSEVSKEGWFLFRKTNGRSGKEPRAETWVSLCPEHRGMTATEYSLASAMESRALSRVRRREVLDRIASEKRGG